jgi:TonB family protein
VRKALIGSLFFHVAAGIGVLQWIAVKDVTHMPRNVYEVKLVGAVQTANAQTAAKVEPAPTTPARRLETTAPEMPTTGIRKATARPDSNSANTDIDSGRHVATATGSRFAIDAPAQESPTGKSGPVNFDDVDARMSSSSPALHLTHPGPYSEAYIILRAVKPKYPEHERERGVEGSVTVELLVDEQGMVANANVLDQVGPDSFRTSALEAVRQFEFQAPIEHGEPSTMWIKFVIKFRING